MTGAPKFCGAKNALDKRSLVKGVGTFTGYYGTWCPFRYPGRLMSKLQYCSLRKIFRVVVVDIVYRSGFPIICLCPKLIVIFEPAGMSRNRHASQYFNSEDPNEPSILCRHLCIYILHRLLRRLGNNIYQYPFSLSLPLSIYGLPNGSYFVPYQPFPIIVSLDRILPKPLRFTNRDDLKRRGRVKGHARNVVPFVSHNIATGCDPFPREGYLCENKLYHIVRQNIQLTTQVEMNAIEFIPPEAFESGHIFGEWLNGFGHWTIVFRRRHAIRLVSYDACHNSLMVGCRVQLFQSKLEETVQGEKSTRAYLHTVFKEWTIKVAIAISHDVSVGKIQESLRFPFIVILSVHDSFM